MEVSKSSQEGVISLTTAAPVESCFLSFMVAAKIRGFNKNEGKNQAEHASHFILLMKSYLSGSVKSKFLNDKIDDLAFQWLSPHLLLPPLLACVQLNGGYKCTWLSASFQLSHSQPSAPETHYCSLWLILN